MLWFTQLDWALFFSALVSSTLFPGGSEALLLFRLEETPNNVIALVLTATIGNVLGSIITYAMGRYGFQLSHRWFRISENKISHAEQYFSRFGKLSLLLAWLPVIGDPLCLVAGALRYHIIGFMILVSIGKLGRYAILAWAFL